MANEVNNNIYNKEEQTMFDFDFNEIKELLDACDAFDKQTEAIFSNPDLLCIESCKIRNDAAIRYRARKKWTYDVQILKPNNVEQLDLVFYVNSAGFIVESHKKAFANLSETIKKHTGPIQIKLCCGGKKYREKTVLIPACEHMLEKRVIKQPDLERLCKKHFTNNLFKLYYATDNEFAKDIVHKYNGYQFDKMNIEANSDHRLYPLAQLIRWAEAQKLNLYLKNMPRVYEMAVNDIAPITPKYTTLSEEQYQHLCYYAAAYGVEIPTYYEQAVTCNKQSFIVEAPVILKSDLFDIEEEITEHDEEAESVYITKQWASMKAGKPVRVVNKAKLDEALEILTYLQSCGDEYLMPGWSIKDGRVFREVENSYYHDEQNMRVGTKRTVEYEGWSFERK